ncbi:3-oxoacyl-ACP reductase FabG [Aquibacillus albus]|uniref:3-oxoacyl-[acyl-carrier protein] reductase n=1 Tax=Aquibacillus albus TaxID=1168171 RepID=A0ABS2MWC1_9BACI|nr:3-oxoacyl-ACP reductase FabG [Aquibacillus albus]MBM7570182.1 3-oxoacyl-[acyl-carrier protein] reductase [Aquibacillus albus]
MNFEGKSVVVTGGSKGIGKGIASVFAKLGADVAVVARNQDTAASAVSEIKRNGYRAEAFQADVTDRSSLERMTAQVAEAYGGIDILCANAGIFPNVGLEEMTTEDWDLVLNTNAKGALFSLQACLPYLKEAKGGRVVLTSSITGPITGYSGWSHYGASKSAQLGFMKSAALELAKYQITVNAVLPGNVMTEGLQDMGETYLENMTKAIPLARLGDVEDIGYTAAFLASQQAGYITGQTITVDGGQTVPEDLDSF